MIDRSRRLAALLLVLALGLAACSRSGDDREPSPQEPSPPPGQQAGTPAPPPAEKPPESQPPAPAPLVPPEVGTCVPASAVESKPSGYLTARSAVTRGICGAAVPEDQFWLSFWLPPGVTEEAARAALQVEGPQPDQYRFWSGSDGGQLEVWFPKGPLGEEITVRLAGPVGPNGAKADLGYQLRRLASPTATAELKVGDGPFQPLLPGATVPAQPLYIRFRFTGNPTPEFIENQIKEAFEPHKDATSRTIFHLQWESPESLLLSLPAPPARTQIAFNGIEGENGLTMRHFAFVLYTGEPPRLAALDPATGQETALTEVPADILGRNSSPDGRWVLVSALEGDSGYAAGYYLLDTTTATLQKTPLAAHGGYRGGFWLGDRLIWPVVRQVQVYDLNQRAMSEYPSAADHLTSLSADGRLLAGFTLDYQREDPETWLAPATLVVHDLQTHTERVYEDAASVGVPHKSAPPFLSMRFSDDHTALYFQEYVKGSTPEQRIVPRWMKLDLQSGAVSPADRVPEPAPESPTPAKGSTGWSYVTNEWGPVLLRSPEGQEQSFGSGLVLGWQPDGKLLLVRWPNFELRRHPGI